MFSFARQRQQLIDPTYDKHRIPEATDFFLRRLVDCDKTSATAPINESSSLKKGQFVLSHIDFYVGNAY